MNCCKNCKNGLCHKTCCGKSYECGLGYVRPKVEFEPAFLGHGGITVTDQGYVKGVDGNQPACNRYSRR